MVTGAATPPSSGSRVDLNALRTNQTLIVAFVVLAFILGSDIGAWIVAAVAISLAVGAGRPGYGPFQVFYRRAVIGSGFVRAKPRPDDPAPHRFAQAVGAIFLIASAILLFAGATTIGWVLAWIVVVLALTNLVFGFCAGCFVFYQLRKAGIGA